jgi:hypothetical protein
LPAISLIKSLFTSLVIRQSVLRLTSSFLFGDPYFFEVLKFKGGITIIPQQNAFPLQTVQTKFNFSLNFPIYQIQSNYNELTSQLKSGLRLTSYEVCQIFSPKLFKENSRKTPFTFYKASLSTLLRCCCALLSRFSRQFLITC